MNPRNKKSPVAPPVYNPQSKPAVAQQKVKNSQVAPAPYRPQPVPKVLQTKKSNSQPVRPQLAVPPRPANPNSRVMPVKSGSQPTGGPAKPVGTRVQIAQPKMARPNMVIQRRLLSDDNITNWVTQNPPTYKNGNEKKNLDAYTYVFYFKAKMDELGRGFDEEDLIKAIAVATAQGIVKAYDKNAIKMKTKTNATASAKLRQNRTDADPTMAASMYDYYAGRWHLGKSGHGKGQGNVLAAVWNRIGTVVDADRYQFGQNCAEVDCLIRAYAARPAWLQAYGIGKCVFQAARVNKNPTSQDACGGCRTWITQSGAHWS